jgi:hypothetical protein
VSSVASKHQTKEFSSKRLAERKKKKKKKRPNWRSVYEG